MKCNFLLLLILGIVCSCSKDDYYDSALEGEWVLTEMSCGHCGYRPETFDKQRLIFHESKNQVVIESPENLGYLAPSGEYPFENEDGTLTIHGRKYTYEVHDDAMDLIYLDDPQLLDDELSLYYTRVDKQ